MLWIVIVGFIIGFALAFSIGANDVANSFGTSVGSKVLTLKAACILATIFETAGSVLVGAKVSQTISKGIIDISLYNDSIDLLRLGYLSALIGACIWLLIATLFKLPVSGTHSIVGAVIGFTVVSKGFSGVRWWVLLKIVSSWFISPVFSGAVSAGIYMFVYVTILRVPEHQRQLNRGILLLPLFYSVTFAVNCFSVVYDGPEILYFHVVPWWGALIISVGVGLVAAGIVRFIVGPRLKRHIILTRPNSMAMSALRDEEDGTAKKPLSSSSKPLETVPEQKTPQLTKDCEISNGSVDKGKKIEEPSKAIQLATSIGSSRRPSQSDSGKCSMGPANNGAVASITGIPLLDHQTSIEYAGIPSGFASSSTASGLNSADISGTSTPLLVTPRNGKQTPSLNVAAQKFIAGGADPSNVTTPPNSPELAPKKHQDVMSSLESSQANSSETIVTVVSAIEKKTAKFYEPDLNEEDEHTEQQQATIVPGTTLQAALKNRETPAMPKVGSSGANLDKKVTLVDAGDNKDHDGGGTHHVHHHDHGDYEEENQLTITSFIGRDISRRKRTQSARSAQSARSVSSSRLDHEANEWPDVLKLFAFLQILTACFGAFAHGGNDVSNAVGPVIGIYQLHNVDTIPDKAQPQWWILFLGGCGISVGLWVLGRRVIETVGNDLTQVTPPSGFSIEIGAATTVLFASQIGIPVSTTHCKVGSVVFVGLCRGRNQVDWHIFRNIVLAWFITVPASAAFSAGVMAAMKEIFYTEPSFSNVLMYNATDNSTLSYNFTTTVLP